MTGSATRLVRCPRCRLQIETVEAAPICPACGELINDGMETPTVEDDARERTPTRPNAIIRPDK